METIEVIDTAVKVGLGALTGSATTYWLAKLNHRNEMEKDRLRRRREMIEEIVSHCNTMSHAVRNYWSLITDWVAQKNKTPAPPDKITTSSDCLNDCFLELTTAEGKLLLLGESGVQARLRDYAFAVKGFYETAHTENDDLSYGDLEGFMKSIRKAREDLLLALSKTYAKPAA